MALSLTDWQSIPRSRPRSGSENSELGEIVSLSVPGSIEEQEETSLYSLSAPGTKPCEIKMIPYFAWDNRAPGEMLVWLTA